MVTHLKLVIDCVLVERSLRARGVQGVATVHHLHAHGVHGGSTAFVWLLREAYIKTVAFSDHRHL